MKPYIDVQFERLFDLGGRVVYLYNSMDRMLADTKFCRYDRSDYMIFGNMTEPQAEAYQKSVGQEIPPGPGPAHHEQVRGHQLYSTRV